MGFQLQIADYVNYDYVKSVAVFFPVQSDGQITSVDNFITILFLFFSHIW